MSTLVFFSDSHSLIKIEISQVCSLGGVVLIARPAFLFGSAAHDISVGIGEGMVGLPEVTPAQRLGAVGWVIFRSPLA